ncbi:DeoR/GlpR family DNA-binding transcription regulator [Flagellimonas meridianipacifica]|uniref:DeoR/GlpR family transcriptional regulator of sugar metabolism n=1 Tax=Flagellimonas meridianipacifica TaxID=1080225 RepID=A0A2T0M9M9_9FLAO|nr:DeoR/GlpR family DNA-binding transcription regulator [Allomuricauda pacifica]PRX54236.1 DeoR/GlpR family transcriptional regulator of sugar metabolism [Allomuricauda pacifica]
MLKEERHQFILNEVRIHNRVLLTDIADLLKVSVDTVRRDIKELHNTDQLKKVHGGAISLGFNTYSPVGKKVYSLEKKSQIAEKAITLIKEGQVILLSGGTTNLELARRLPSKMKLTCFTPSLPIAVQLLTKSNVEVIFIGGRLSKDSQITVGGSAINMLSEIKVDICFLGTNSIHPVQGLTEFDWEIVQMKKAMIHSSRKVVSPCISEKIGSLQRYKICGTEDVDVLITELEPWDIKLDAFKTMNLQLL